MTIKYYGPLDLLNQPAKNLKLADSLDANSKKITGLANGTDSGDAVNYGQLGALGFKATIDSTSFIDDAIVSYEKIQNVSATDKLLGRSTAGAGSVEEIACTSFARTILDDANASAARTTLGLGTSAVAALIDDNSFATATTSNTASAASVQAYVDDQVLAATHNFSYKDPVRVVATSNVDIASELTNGDTLSSVTLATGNRVLLIGQTDASENGIYVVVASGAASRSVDADADSEVTSGLMVNVLAGDEAGSKYILTTSGSITVDTTDLSFTEYHAGASYNAGTGLTLTGSTFSITAGGVNTTQLAADAVNGDKIADDSIDSEHLVDGSIDTAHVANSAISYAKIQNVSATDKLLGRSTAGSGAVEEINCTSYGRGLLNTANEAAFKTLVNLQVGTDVLAQADVLDDIAALSVTDGNIIVGNGSTFVAESGATALASLGLSNVARPFGAEFNNTTSWSGTGPYTITYAAGTHGRGATKELIVQVKEVLDGTNNVVGILTSIADNGDVTITSTSSKFAGDITIIG